MNSKYARYNAMADEALASIREDRDKKYASRVVQHDQETWDAYQATLTPWRILWLKDEPQGITPHNEVTLEYVCTHPEIFWLLLEKPIEYPGAWDQPPEGGSPILLAKVRYVSEETLPGPFPLWKEIWGAYDVGYWSLKEVLDSKSYYLRWLVEWNCRPARW